MIERYGCQVLISILLFFSMMPIVYSCTLSFQNISTHGTATDLVDDTQDASPEVEATVTPMGL
jgi:hypothetical protein